MSAEKVYLFLFFKHAMIDCAKWVQNMYHETKWQFYFTLTVYFYFHQGAFILVKFLQNSVGKIGPLFIVNNVVMNEAQLTQKSLSYQSAFYLSTRRICLTNLNASIH